ncbi:hypothetical protein Hanom_Chr01g00005951 [Helianthus anomalus]
MSHNPKIKVSKSYSVHMLHSITQCKMLLTNDTTKQVSQTKDNIPCNQASGSSVAFPPNGS